MNEEVILTSIFRKEFFNSDIYSTEEKEIFKLLSVTGLNKKNILIITNRNDAAQQDQLNKILNYTRLTMDDIHLFFLGKDEIVPLKHFGLESYCKVLVFGVSSQQLRMNFSSTVNSIIHYDGIEILFTTSLEELNEDMVKKKALVAPLNKLFNISRT